MNRRRDLEQTSELRMRAAEHELKTPITGVRALLQSLLLGSIPEDARRDLLRRGVRECDRLDRLVDRILAACGTSLAAEEEGEADAPAPGNTRA